MAVKEKIRVRLKSYDHVLIDTAAKKIVEVATRNGAEVSGSRFPLRRRSSPSFAQCTSTRIAVSSSSIALTRDSSTFSSRLKRL